MRNTHSGIAGLFVLAALAGANQGAAAGPAEIAARRQASVNNILTTLPARAVAAQRLTCMFGEVPDNVAKARRALKDSVPDAADTCIAALTRTAHDGQLLDLYRLLLTKLGGNVAGYEKLPTAIGEALLGGAEKVALGNGKDTIVASALAFDAGFTVAYMKGETRVEGMDAAKLKLVAEDCLAVHKDPGTCFSAGYAYGGQAFTATR